MSRATFRASFPRLSALWAYLTTIIIHEEQPSLRQISLCLIHRPRKKMSLRPRCKRCPRDPAVLATPSQKILLRPRRPRAKMHYGSCMYMVIVQHVLHMISCAMSCGRNERHMSDCLPIMRAFCPTC